MHDLAADHRLSAVYGLRGPFVTVYLDATRSTESGAHEVELRWRDVRERLETGGADEAALDAIADAIAADVGAGGPHGLVLVAAGGEVCFADRLTRPPATSTGRVSALPHLLPYLAQQATDVPHVAVIADRTGADVLAVSADGGSAEQSVEGDTSYPIHRTGRDSWSERHFQNRVENTWESNARDVAAEVTRHVKQLPARLVVVAGDVRASHLIADDVTAAVGPNVAVTIIDDGGRAAGSSGAALEAAVHDQVLRQAWRERREVLEHLQQNLGRAAYATAGAAEVAAALQMAQVDTVVLSDDPTSTLRAWVGPQPSEFGLDDAEAAALGLGTVEHDRYDAALVRAVVGTGAKMVVTPGAHEYLKDGIGALLRFDTPSE